MESNVPEKEFPCRIGSRGSESKLVVVYCLTEFRNMVGGVLFIAYNKIVF